MKTLSTLFTTSCGGCFLCQSDTLKSFRKREAQLRKMPHQIPVVKSNGIFRVDDWWCRTQLIVEGAKIGLVLLRCMRKQTEQAMGRKSICSIPSWSLLQFPVTRLIPWVPTLTSLAAGLHGINERKLFLPKLLLDVVFYQSNRKLTNSFPQWTVLQSAISPNVFHRISGDFHEAT